jgi:hypothetical protein
MRIAGRFRVEMEDMAGTIGKIGGMSAREIGEVVIHGK